MLWGKRTLNRPASASSLIVLDNLFAELLDKRESDGKGKNISAADCSKIHHAVALCWSILMMCILEAHECAQIPGTRTHKAPYIKQKS